MHLSSKWFPTSCCWYCVLHIENPINKDQITEDDFVDFTQEDGTTEPSVELLDEKKSFLLRWNKRGCPSTLSQCQAEGKYDSSEALSHRESNPTLWCDEENMWWKSPAEQPNQKCETQDRFLIQESFSQPYPHWTDNQKPKYSPKLWDNGLEAAFQLRCVTV